MIFKELMNIRNYLIHAYFGDFLVFTLLAKPVFCFWVTRKRCTTEAWKAIEMVYGEKRRNPIYICETCTLDADTKEVSVPPICNSCLEWQHLSCARLKSNKNNMNGTRSDEKV
jgi:hypothetical protein